MIDDERVSVHILTGFLGSGKTTLLRNILQSGQFANSAVLVNEFGEAGLDHLLVARLDDSTVLLSNGCICCTVRDDLKAALLGLLRRRGDGKTPFFDRIFLETTGLADPVPIVATLKNDMTLRHNVRLGTIITTADAVNAIPTLEGYSQNARQIGVADKIVITKTDMTERKSLLGLEARIRQINSSAPIIRAAKGVVDHIEALFASDPDKIPDSSRDKAHEAGVFTRFRAESAGWREAHGLPSTLSLFCDEPVEWAAFGLWLSLLVARCGGNLLRIKGLVDVQGSETPIVVQGVQSLLYPAEHLPAWPSERRRTSLVLIGYDLDQNIILRSMKTFLSLGNDLKPATPPPT